MSDEHNRNNGASTPLQDATTSKPIRILWLDDEPGFTRLMNLAMRGRYSVTEANTAKQALDLLKKSSFDVMICDFIMPRIDGGKVAEIVRRRYPDLPFGFVTAIVSAKETATTTMIDGYPVAAKPVTKDSLIQFIEFVLRAKHQAPVECGETSLAPPSVRSTVGNLFPYIVGGLLHDAKNTMFAAREKIRRLEAKCGITDDKQLIGSIRFIAEQVESLDHVLEVIHQISRSYYTREDQLVPSIDEQASDLVKEFQQRFPNIQFKAYLDEGFEECRFPPGVSLFVVRELLQNAVKACSAQPGATITLQTYFIEGHVAVFGCDNSHGEFPESKLDQIRRQAVRPEKGEMTGGRGLYYISEIAKRLGGYLSAENRQPTGARIEITFSMTSIE